MIKVLLVDDQKSIRERLKLLLELETNFEVVGTAENGTIAIEKTKSLRPDIILLDLTMPEMDGIETAKTIKNYLPNCKIFILTSYSSEEYLDQIKQAEVEGFFLKGTSDRNIIQTLENIDKRKINSNYKFRPYSKWIFILFGIIIGLFIVNLTNKPEAEIDLADADKFQPQTTRVVALGKLIPKGEVIKLSVANAEDSRVNKILVEEGDLVESGQVIAILQGFENRQRELEEAQKDVELARARLKQVRAGDTKQAELAAQRANISRLESQLRNETVEREAAIASAEAQLKQAQINYDRNSNLQQQGAVTQQALDEAKEALDMARAALDERKAQLNNTTQTLQQEITQEQKNLARLQEIRPVDVKVAEIELEKAIVAVKQVEADLEDTKVKVPISGQILRINTRVGEQVNTQQGIVELGRTDEMYAIAEVYETDIGKVKIGQPATISSEYGGFKGKLSGTVEHLGLQVGAKQLSEGSQDPTQDENSRIVEVKIRIDPEDSKKVAGLTNMKVRVEIDNQ